MACTRLFSCSAGCRFFPTLVFRELKNTDGDTVSQHNVIVAEGSHEMAVTSAATTPVTVNDRSADRESV